MPQPTAESLRSRAKQPGCRVFGRLFGLRNERAHAYAPDAPTVALSLGPNRLVTLPAEYRSRRTQQTRVAFVHFGALVGGVRRDQVANPTEQPARAYPEARRDDQPKNAAQEVAIVNLTNSRNDQREYCCVARSVHDQERRTSRLDCKRRHLTRQGSVKLPPRLRTGAAISSRVTVPSDCDGKSRSLRSVRSPCTTRSATSTTRGRGRALLVSRTHCR